MFYGPDKLDEGSLWSLYQGKVPVGIHGGGCFPAQLHTVRLYAFQEGFQTCNLDSDILHPYIIMDVSGDGATHLPAKAD